MKDKTKKSIYKRWWFWVIVVFVIGVIGSNMDSNATTTKKKATTDQTNKQEKATTVEKTKKEKPVVLTPQQKMFKDIKALIDSKQAFDTGSYIQGDIPAGDYAFVSFKGSGKYYSESDASNNIIDNQNFDSFGYVHVHAAGNLETQGVLINVSAIPQLGVSGAKEIYEKLNELTDFKESGYYKVGVDIPAGSYVLESMGSGYAAVVTGPVGQNDIVNNENFNGRYSVTVKDGQYLELTRAKITQ